MTAGSCSACAAWGELHTAEICRGCYDFARRNEPGPCGSCRRHQPLREGYCRGCWLQAGLQSAEGPAAVSWHQLSFAGLATTDRRAAGTAPAASPALEQARGIAARLGEARGWNTRARARTARSLAVMLASHVPGGKIPWSALPPALAPRGLDISRTAEILALAGLLDDDRVPALDTLTQSKLATLAPGIADCARSWLDALQHGTPRARPRKPDTVRAYLRSVHPVLEDWSARYGHLREVTAADVTAATARLRGRPRGQLLAALRSLTRHCKKNGLIFADPAACIPAPERPETIILPLPASRVSAVTEADLTPAARLALVLAAVHALRPEVIRHLVLDDIDLPDRRITIAGQSRPLDDLTRTLTLQWLGWRRQRWPRTSSPYLLINNQTAMTIRPVSENWLPYLLRGLSVTLEQLRADRQLDEALTAGPDPLHLAAVFGIGDAAAIRYASAARRLLASAAEDEPPR